MQLEMNMISGHFVNPVATEATDITPASRVNHLLYIIKFMYFSPLKLKCD